MYFYVKNVNSWKNSIFYIFLQNCKIMEIRRNLQILEIIGNICKLQYMEKLYINYIGIFGEKGIFLH